MRTSWNGKGGFKRGALALGLASLVVLAAGVARAEERAFRLRAVEVDGVKFWLPSVIVVKKGDQVKIQAESKVPGDNSVHGLKIGAFKVEEIVDTKGKEIRFKADKTGVYGIDCHMHPAHIGGQLVVLEK
ncbi:MAG: cupredoxin domain-containing protein [Bacteriovoracia bacterium]